MDTKSRVPKEFYKLFTSKYVDRYQLALIALYEESGQSYSLLGLTEEECQEIVREKMAFGMEQQEQGGDDEEDGLFTRQDMPSVLLRRLESWGWLRRDYDETLNRYVVSFPDYSQMFIEVFRRLFEEGDQMERGSILAVYSYLFTYYSDAEKNNEILKSALHMSKSLQQMLSDMQEGIRGYFEELSAQKTFLGIQQVLIDEINNSNSQKYAILTTTDSFYRYKEEIKELLDKNLADTETRKQRLVEAAAGETRKDGVRQSRNAAAECEEAMELLFRISREFDGIERRYGQLIDQKRIFAKRAAARIRYILAEGDAKEDRTKAFVKLLGESPRQDEMLEELARGFGLTKRFAAVKEKSFARPRNAVRQDFAPQAVELWEDMTEDFGDFVVKPLYTRAQLEEFWKENETEGTFRVTEHTVQSVEDLEKLLFVWQEATEAADSAAKVETDGEFVTKDGFCYSGFSVSGRKEHG